MVKQVPSWDWAECKVCRETVAEAVSENEVHDLTESEVSVLTRAAVPDVKFSGRSQSLPGDRCVKV